MWSQSHSSNDGGGWNPNPHQAQPPSYGPPSLRSLPPPPFNDGPTTGPGWSASGPNSPFCGPCQPFSARGRGHYSHPSFSGPRPSFSAPPPSWFSGPPPPFGNNQPSQNSSQGPYQGASVSWSGSADCRKRPENMVWSDPSLFSPSQKSGFEHHNGHPRHHNRGWGGGGGGGRGCGRGGHQFQQHQSNNRNGANFVENTNRQNSKKKKKVNKRDLPENNQYHCDICDRGFKTEEKYEEHVDQHTQCSVAGCPYVAAPKLVQLHYFSQHKTGLAKRIWSLDSPESLKKWIEDRKRNYPTKENIARKEKERAERRARGEVIDNKQFSKMWGHGRGGRGYQRGHRGGQQGRRSQPFDGSTEQEDSEEKLLSGSHPSQQDENQQEDDPSSWKADRVSGKGGHSQENTTSEELNTRKRKLDDEEKTLKRNDGGDRDPLSLILGQYGSSESDSDESEEMESVANASTPEARVDHLASYHDLTKEEEWLPETVKEGSEEAEEQMVTEVTELKGKGTWPTAQGPQRWLMKEEPAWKRNNKYRSIQKHRRNILLESLLASEIRHERNILLQCVHYIVRNSFLGVLDKESETGKTAGDEAALTRV